MGSNGQLYSEKRTYLCVHLNDMLHSFGVIQRSTKHIIITICHFNRPFKRLLCRANYVQGIGKNSYCSSQNGAFNSTEGTGITPFQCLFCSFQATNNPGFYFIDCTFSVLGIGTLVIFVWRSMFALCDLLIYSTDPHLSALYSLVCLLSSYDFSTFSSNSF